MKIKRIETYLLQQELTDQEVFAFSQFWVDRRTYLVVEIECAGGTVGFGEAFGPPAVNAAVVDSVFAPLLLGRDPLDRETLWMEMYNKLRDHGRKGGAI